MHSEVVPVLGNKGAGKIVTAPLRSGQKVRVYYTGAGEQRVVEHVQVEE